MPKLPVVSGPQLLRVLTVICYQVINKRGDHVTLGPKRASNPDRTCLLVIPMHKELKIGTLMTILARASLSKDEFVKLLHNRRSERDCEDVCMHPEIRIS